MPQTPQSNRRAGRFQVTWLTAIFGAVGYAAYASYTRTGLAGYVMKIQMDWWGSASDTSTMMTTAFIMVVAMSVVAVIVERLFPSMHVTTEDAQRMARPPGPISGKWVLVICLVPILAGGVVSAFWYQSEREDAKAPVYSIDLTSSPAAPPKDARFVEVTGSIARPYVLSYKKTEDQKVTHELFAPLTAGEAAVHSPVRYIVHHEASEEYNGQVNWPDVFRHKGATRFSGRVGRSLPAYVTSSLRSKGLTLDPSYAVIEWKDLQYRQWGGTGGDSPWFFPLALGGLLSLIAVPMMLMVKFMQGRVNRQQHTTGLHA